MIKQTLKYSIVFLFLLIIGFYSQEAILTQKNISLTYSLWSVYIFHFLFSLSICVILSVLSFNEKFYQQLGFIYLGTLVFKIVIFCFVFNNIVFRELPLSKTESLSMLIPLAVFLIGEVYFIAQVLNRKQSGTIK
mgnify:CR=1 FL=1